MIRTSHEKQRAAKTLARGGVLTVRASKGARVTPGERVTFLRRGDAIRVGRGVYQSTARREVVGPHPYKAIAAVLAGEPYFVSWWSALAHHGLTEQMPLVVHVAVQTQHRRQVLAGYDVTFVRLKAEKFLGVSTITLDGIDVQIATPERALLDCLDRPDLGGGLPEVVRALTNPKIDPEQVVDLALRLPSTALIRRLGYLMTVLGIGDPTPLLGGVGTSAYTRLDVGGVREGRIDRHWWISDNIGADIIERWAARDT